MTISECGSHATSGRSCKGTGEQSLARWLYPRLAEDWLLIADRNFYNFGGWTATAASRFRYTHDVIISDVKHRQGAAKLRRVVAHDDAWRPQTATTA